MFSLLTSCSARSSSASASSTWASALVDLRLAAAPPRPRRGAGRSRTAPGLCSTICAVLEQDLLEIARDPGPDVDALGRLEAARELVPLGDRHHERIGDGDRRRRQRRARLAVARVIVASAQRHGCGDDSDRPGQLEYASPAFPRCRRPDGARWNGAGWQGGKCDGCRIERWPRPINPRNFRLPHRSAPELPYRANVFSGSTVRRRTWRSW